MATNYTVQIHPTACVHPKAQIGEGVDVGPYCVVGEHVTIGPGTRLMSHVVLDGYTEIGERCEIYPGAVIGTRSQDLKYRGGVTRVRIGDQNTVREYVTVHTATGEESETFIGDRNLIMAYAHIAHDCRIEDGVIIANAVTMGGHVTIESQAIVGGMVGIHQFVRVGRLSIIGGFSKLVKDIPPFMMADGHPVKVFGINRLGLERAGLEPRCRDELKKAHRLLYRSDLAVTQALARIEKELASYPELTHLVRFIRESERGITK
ncbi:MAG: acyl-ACP--UDP-N-acetylglucosamine O-acyltransferase [Candidatus Omnitrophica bacterium]|nr:acyl-ACP--UDP-N-acetylglucosamine O-acyltransferase [Candidatus Omnitrophota bacterium]